MVDLSQEYSEEKYVFYLELVIQRNLLLLLKVADISVEKFATSLGITAQTIRNLSAYDTFISRTQFISIMSMFEIERRKGPNKEAVDTLLSSLLHADIYKKYSDNFLKFSKEHIFGKDRKLSKKNYEMGIFAALAAFGVAGVVGAAVGFSISTILANANQKNELYEDIKRLEEANDKVSFLWMNSLYNVKDTLQSYKKYNDFIDELKKCNSLEEKGDKFDEYIASLLKDLCKD